MLLAITLRRFLIGMFCEWRYQFYGKDEDWGGMENLFV